MFIFYMICAYFLVILPLPSISEVRAMTGPVTQLIPFSFVTDFIRNSSFDVAIPSTYLKAIRESYFYVPVFNIFLTLPFGVFIRYLFKCNFKKTLLCSFMLSLFFELTQLSGLYFIYPRGYRLFDVDDLILNTLGGICGYFLCGFLMKFVPSIDQVNEEMSEKGKTVSGFRRTLAAMIDFVIIGVIEVFTRFLLNERTVSYVVFLGYFVVVPMFMNSTLGKAFLKIKIASENGKVDLGRTVYRNILFVTMYFVVPGLLLHYCGVFTDLFIVIAIFLFYFISGIKYTFTNGQLWYEKLSKTKLASTIE